MNHKEEFRGHWWSKSESDSVGGVVTFDPTDGIEVELFSRIQDNYIADDNIQIDNIYGVTTDNQFVTVVNCVQTSESFKHNNNNRSVSTANYTAELLLVGDELRKPGIEFERARITHPQLYQWIGVSGLMFDRSDPNVWSFDYKVPDTNEFETESSILRFIITSSSSQSVSGRFTLKEDGYLEIDPKSGTMSTDDVKQEVKKWRNFFTLAIGEEISITEVRCYQKTEDQENTRSVRMLYTTVGDFSTEDTFHPNKANFILEDIEENPGVFTQWENQSDLFQEIYDIYFSIVYESKMYIQNQYLMLINAIEMFYEKSRGIAENDSQGKHLKEKLSIIIQEYHDIFEYLPWDLKNEIQGLVDIRNRVVHGHAGSEIDSERLYDKVLLLRAMLESILLSELGIPHDQVGEKLGKRYGQMAVVSFD